MTVSLTGAMSTVFFMILLMESKYSISRVISKRANDITVYNIISYQLTVLNSHKMKISLESTVYPAVMCALLHKETFLYHTKKTWLVAKKKNSSLVVKNSIQQ